MPDPREAVYDVLLAKKRRAEDERRLLRSNQTLAEAYEEWTAKNKTAGSQARG